MQSVQKLDTAIRTILAGHNILSPKQVSISRLKVVVALDSVQVVLERTLISQSRGWHEMFTVFSRASQTAPGGIFAGKREDLALLKIDMEALLAVVRYVTNCVTPNILFEEGDEWFSFSGF